MENAGRNFDKGAFKGAIGVTDADVGVDVVRRLLDVAQTSAGVEALARALITQLAAEPSAPPVPPAPPPVQGLVDVLLPHARRVAAEIEMELPKLPHAPAIVHSPYLPRRSSSTPTSAASADASEEAARVRRLHRVTGLATMAQLQGRGYAAMQVSMSVCT